MSDKRDDRPTLVLPPFPEARKHLRPQGSLLFGLVTIAISVAASLALTYFWLGTAKSLYDQRTEDVVRKMLVQSTSSGRTFVPRDGNHYYQEDVVFEPIGKYQWSFLTDPEGLVVAIHVQFEPGDDVYFGRIATPWHVPKVVRLERGNGIGFFDYGARIVVLDRF